MPQPTILLSTQRLRLRQFTVGDVDNIVALDSDPDVMRYITLGQPTPRATIEQRVLPSWLKFYESGGHIGFWAAELLATGEFIGWFHLRPDRFEPEQQEVGYRFHKRYWGQGLASEGGRALINDGFTVSQFAVISARALQGNLASQRVMQKCGLKFECEFVYPEHILRGGSELQRRAVKYSASRENWLAANGAHL
jgi:RimJ/RimL family protein N-acetyltransferase